MRRKKSESKLFIVNAGKWQIDVVVAHIQNEFACNINMKQTMEYPQDN